MKAHKELKLFTLVTINITAVLSLSSIAYMATLGAQCIFFFAVAAIMFFIPSALVSAELGSMMTENNGGVYTWVSRAFGNKAGLVAIWMEWFNNVIALPGSLSALIATFSYLGFPALAKNPGSMFMLMLILMWLITLFNFLPIRKISILNIIGAVGGMILPGGFLIIGAIYYFSVHPRLVNFSYFDDIAPTFSFATFALLGKALSSYSGIQAVAFYMRDVKKPLINIPLSIIIAVVIIFGLTTCATISLSSLISINHLNPMNGLIQGITFIMQQFGLNSLIPALTLCVCLGMIASTSTWVLGPSRAIQEVARDKMLPPILAVTNKHKMPVGALVIQAFIGSLLATLFLVMPSLKSAFAVLIALTSQFTVVMFIMVFASSIKLRFSEPDTFRSFKVGGDNNIILIICATLGIIACSLGFFLGLFPPKFSGIQNIKQYVCLMALSDVIILSIPFLYLYIKGKKAVIANIIG